jgi:hypothetical protein
MAAYQHRGNAVRAIIRRRGYPTVTRTFESRNEAESWATQVERSMRNGGPLPLIASVDKTGGVSRTETYLTEQQIVIAAQSFTKFSGVYFLTLGDSVVYVGMSVHVLGRIGQHAQTSRKFDGYHVIPCSEERAAVLEKHYIKLLQPEGNTAHKYRLAELLDPASSV